ncbi:MerC domain-containing protein [Cesiribacter sp. SM1]|uniref:MerC domain-containing protein n=1 Tax=Cesiribacter sp. SM1 TaxID=2861196 RepID=UPI001CD2F8C9|nr:MerC domain-containing protein [Cesiribacter sp. SM1]
MRARFVSLHLDAFGFFASLLCAVHCALLPLLLVFLPLAQRTYLHSSLAEGILLLGSFAIAAISLRLSYLKHRRKRVLITMLSGFCLISAGIMLAPSMLAELLMTSSGGGFVAIGHYLNWRYTHK